MPSSASSNRSAVIGFVIGLTITVFVTILFRTTDLDLQLQGLAYSPSEPHWPYSRQQPWRFLHDFGTLPGLALAIVAICYLGASFADDRFARWRSPGLYIVFLMALGPGLVTNVLGKVLCGRPRPDEILQFAGPYVFHGPFELGSPGKGFSFLCGHCSMGFLFAALFWILRGWARWLALIGSILFGLWIGAGRVIQGAHFPSDILLDASVMIGLTAALSPIARLKPRTRVAMARWKVLTGTAVLLVLLIVGFLFSTPVNKERLYRWVGPKGDLSTLKHESAMRWRAGTGPSEPRAVWIELEKGDIELDVGSSSDPLRIRSLTKGFGFPGAGTRSIISRHNGTLRYRQFLEGFFWEYRGRLEVIVAKSTAARLHVRTRQGSVNLRGLDARSILLSGSFAFSDPRQLFRRSGGGRFIHEGKGEPLVLSVIADKVIVER